MPENASNCHAGMVQKSNHSPGKTRNVATGQTLWVTLKKIHQATMATDNWYRNTIWNSNKESNFESHLKRSRGAYNKAEYLRIQANYLLGSSDSNTQIIGIRLIERLINDFPSEVDSVICGNEMLGDYYLKFGDYEKAEKNFRLVSDHYENTKSRSGTSAMADLKLAKTILTANWTDKFEEAYFICKNYPLNLLDFNSEKFYYAELLAQLYNRLNKKEEAKEFAMVAIEISKIAEPQFNRHKTIGLANATDIQLMALEQIINEY